MSNSYFVSLSPMFRSAIYFNQPLGKWDVSNVWNKDSMFESAIAFCQPSLKQEWKLTKQEFKNMYEL
jgi:hypothetical protein